MPSSTPIESGKWQNRLRPYLWATALSGEARVSGLPKIEFESSFRDVLKTLDIGGMIAYEGTNGRVGVVLDLFYARNSSSGVLPSGLPADGSAKTFFALFAGQFRVYQTPIAEVDVVAGLRYVSFDLDATVFPGPGQSASDRASTTWLDPQLGVKGRSLLGPRWSVRGSLLLALKSPVTFDADLGFGYTLSSKSELQFGYRFLSLSHNSNRIDAEVNFQGPFAGVEFRF